MRPCCCDSEHFAPNGIFSAHDIWPLVSAVAPRDFIMPSIQGSNLDRIPNALLARLKVEDELRYSTHCFRRGASMELLNVGDTLSVIVKTDGWNSPAIRPYQQFRLSEESDMRAVLIQIKNVVQSESEEETTAAIAESATAPLSQRQEGASSVSTTMLGGGTDT